MLNPQAPVNMLNPNPHPVYTYKHLWTWAA